MPEQPPPHGTPPPRWQPGQEEPAWVLGPYADPADAPALCAQLADRLRARGTRRPGAELYTVDIGRLHDRGVGTIELLARLHLTAWRLGYRIRFTGVDARVRALIAWVGLSGVLRLDSAFDSGLEPGRQAEEREQLFGVEERVDPGDAPA